MTAKIQTVAIADIEHDASLQVRARLDNDVIDEYAGLMLAGVQFPPIRLVHDGFLSYWIADGWHRYTAAVKSGATQIQAEILCEGQRRDALLFAATKANREHGLRRSNGDKRRCVEVLLRDPEWCQWSDRKIAEECGVTHPFVSSVRSECSPATESTEFEQLETVTSCEPAKRVGRDGKARKAPKAKPGPSKSKTKATETASPEKPAAKRPKNGAETIDRAKVHAAREALKKFGRLMDEVGWMGEVDEPLNEIWTRLKPKWEGF